MRAPTISPTRGFLSALLIGCVTGVGAVASFAAQDLTISQRNRQFDPGKASLAKNQAIVIANDDGETVHHAYVESDSFNFDSGDQNPGSRTRIVFPVRGDFQVLCGIHPKMKLLVHVK